MVCKQYSKTVTFRFVQQQAYVIFAFDRLSDNLEVIYYMYSNFKTKPHLLSGIYLIYSQTG